jgi:pimeloyl-ACP methyl ester carboxylesterase
MTPAIRSVSANGLRFAYLEEGTGPLAILLHGFPDTPQTWDHVRPALAQAGFRVVTPFMRGYAPTEIPKVERFDADTLGEDVLAIATALGERDFVLVGHDWGASAGYSAVGLAPERIRFLVTVGIPHPLGVTPTPSLVWAVRHFFWLGRAGAPKAMRADDLAYVDELVRRWSPAWKVPPGETDAVKRALREPGSLEAAGAAHGSTRARPPLAQRRKVECAAAAFAGTDDTFSPSVYDGARSRYAAAYEVVKMPGGHFMHREHPEHFTRELLRVLAPYAG